MLTDGQRADLTHVVIDVAGEMIAANDMMFRFGGNYLEQQDVFVMYSELPGSGDMRVTIDITGWFEPLFAGEPGAIEKAVLDLDGLIHYGTVLVLHPLGPEAIGDEDGAPEAVDDPRAE